MTVGMRWAVVGTACLIVFIGAIALVAHLSAGDRRWHCLGGVARVIPWSENSEQTIVCNDGTVIQP